MNKPAAKQQAQTPTQEKKAPAPTRDEIRAKLLGKTPLAETKMISLYGMDIELRQPTLEAILKSRDIDDNVARAVDMIIEYAFVPGTDDHVFETADREMILRWPFGKDLQTLNEAIADLTGVDIAAAMEDMKRDPLAG